MHQRPVDFIFVRMRSRVEKEEEEEEEEDWIFLKNCSFFHM